MSGENTDFLYPFIDAQETDAAPLLADLASSARGKATESARLQAASLEEWGPQIEEAGRAIAERFAAGGRMYTFGNGGSSTDAETLASLFARPAHGRPLAARCLAADQAVITALGNDIGFDVVFSRQLMAHARPGDIAVALSTSGSSEDLMAALVEGRRRGLLTIGFSGHDGGRMAVAEEVDHCFTIRSQSIHRIQESQALVGYRLWATAQHHLEALRKGSAS
ncbi:MULTISPECIES: D-sedoheptulose-7-phosphate isomerase [unclassified Nocardioides]|uniref:D-sedoheptulose-7-phosphate isomerase n=1 Tax=unclassified Nocardioides TaxID=2615069 RepID=UPI0006F3681F|nr:MULTISPECIES: SIS domain-containing protein [unclassified Nocardioides]KRA27982.1 phosphoheptose isomerase [Nocardioides sp. Root614]KRA85956.1 phosphoheptose isomerase [Nocardioides sp. Root682]